MSSASSDEDHKEEVGEKEEEDEKPDSTSQNIEKDAELKKEPIKKNNDTREADVKDDEDEEDEEEDEVEVGLLDRPIEVFGSRERKKVQRFSVSFSTPSKDKTEIPEGKGDKLGDCPRIEFQIKKTHANDLKSLHRVLFGREGTATHVKKNIRKFSGFTFVKDSAEFDKKKTGVDKLKIPALRHICEVLDLERGGSKEDLVNRICDFLLEPKDSGKKLPQPKKKGPKAGKRKRSEKKKSSDDKSKHTSSSEDEHDSDKSDSGKSDEEAKVTSDDEEEEPKKKKVKIVKKKPEKQPAKKGRKLSVKKPSKQEDSDDDDDDEPLVKSKIKPPTNEELKVLVKKILKTADLQQITMKKVIQEVYAHFPEFDLTNKKDFIKATVKSVIS